ncbi:GtrA family protein [Phytohabitans rumicis]|uniref:Membrane protein n=1 Tax=Phytohabitans rumicis TaxID=1076125 RepID=A0A6V8L935_9ACTN|nr:GtrA family protein [Phytohabitans rumicis]GFJ91321.1 membrane protein [Phytohabitans rumicis]
MRLVRLLPERWQKFLREALKFGAVGGANTVLNYALFNVLVLTVLADGQLKATVIATVVATTSSYFMNRHWTFRDRTKSAVRREYTLFFLFNLAGLLIELGVLAVAKYGMDINGLLALNLVKTVGLVLGMTFRFWSYRTFVFRPVPAGAEHPHHFDPVAEIVEAMEEEPTSATVPAQGRDFDQLTEPLEAELISPIDVELDTEFAAELDAARRSTTR